MHWNIKKTWKKIIVCEMAFLLCLGLAFNATGCDAKMTWRVEVGDPLPTEAKQLGADFSPVMRDYDEDCIRHAGTYEICLIDAGGATYNVQLVVVDKTAPVVVPKHVFCAQGQALPKAEDFIGSIEEYDDYTAVFTQELPDLTELGDYDVSFRVEDASGNSTAELHSVVSVIQDTEPPVFVQLPSLSVMLGEAIAYRDGLIVTDNCCGEVNVTVDTSHVNPSVAGSYPVYYTAVDASGNTAQADSMVYIKSDGITEALLNSIVDRILTQIVTPDMSKEEQLRQVYSYIQSNISYVSESDKSDWVRAAYDSLYVSGTGDCFNFFAAAKAFIRRLGIEYLEVQRTPGLTEDTHYWLMVNIGTSEAPQWYHYDCTRLRSEYNHSGCLLTDKQIKAYNMVRANFYAYDTSLYPATSTKIITPTPALEPFYR